MFKDILVPLWPGGADGPALAVACGVAKAFDGHVVALVGAGMPVAATSAWAYYPASAYALVQESSAATAQALADAVAVRLSREGVAFELRHADGAWLSIAEQSVLHAHYADLVVLGVGQERAHVESRCFSALLAGSGRPLLLVPSRADGTGLRRHAVIAWKPSPEAARAVHDAMPLLRRVDTVDLLMVEGGRESRRANAADVDVVPYLERQGLRIRPVRRSCAHSSVGREVLDHAGECGADFVVAGGYGHPRMLEQVFGGATRELFGQAEVPVLFSR